MKKKLHQYKTIVFDCDGVILNSNQIKTKAFYQVALPYGKVAANSLVEYHVENGGISRYEKFKYFLEKIVPSASSTDLESLLYNYAKIVLDGLLDCELSPGVAQLREAMPNINFLIVSGGDQQELRYVFQKRGMSDYFNGGIFGSPDNKDRILKREIANGNIEQPVLFLGDSKYDYLASTSAGMDFVFISGWSEFEDFNEYFLGKEVECFDSISQILD